MGRKQFKSLCRLINKHVESLAPQILLSWVTTCLTMDINSDEENPIVSTGRTFHDRSSPISFI